MTTNAVTSTRFRVAILYFYFTLGVGMTLPALAIKKYLMDDMEIEPSGMAFLLSATAFPWTLKPLYGFFSDFFPICGLRRRPYLFLGTSTNSLIWFIMAVVTSSESPASMGPIALCLALVSATIVMADVSADTLVVENVKFEDNNATGKLQSDTWISRAVGGTLGASFSGVGLDHLGLSVSSMLYIMALISFTGVGAALFTKESLFDASSIAGQSLWTRIKGIAMFWKRPEIWKTSVFLIIFAGSPSSGDAYFYFMRNKLGFTLDFLGWLNVIRHASMAIAVLIFRRYLRTVDFKLLVRSMILLAFFLGMTVLVVVQRWNLLIGIPDSWFVIGDTIALTVCVEVAAMPLVIIAAKVAPEGVEGFIYASIISIVNLSGLLSEASGGAVTRALGISHDNFDNMWKLVLICNITTLFTLPFVSLLPGNITDETRYQQVELAGLDLDDLALSDSIPLDFNETPVDFEDGEQNFLVF